MIYLSAEALTSFGEALLQAYGASAPNAKIIAAHLVDNDLKGVEAHGAMRFYEYVQFMISGKVKGAATPVISVMKPGVFLVEGNQGFGITAMEETVKAMILALQDQPMALAGVKGVGHTGRIGVYAERFAEANCFGQIFGGGGHRKFKTVAPFGGKKGVMSTNPLALALPALEGIPLSADFATSASAGGKIRLAQRKGSLLPPGQILDKQGHPSLNPQDFFDGGVMLPSAGSKGSGLAMINELLCYGLLGQPLEFNWILLAFRLDALCQPSDYQIRAEEFVSLVNATPPAEGYEAVYYPGQMEANRKAANREKGVGVSRQIAAMLAEAALAKGISSPFELDIKDRRK
ncbi:MAG: Ldh family oxidoreductase [Clostridiales bacterium]